MKKKQKKAGAIARMVLSDALAFGVCLVVFAYFHHVRVAPLTPTELPETTPEPMQTSAPQATPAPEDTPEPTPSGLLGGKYAEKFSDSGCVFDETGYRSDTVAIELRTERVYESIVHVADIYIQDIASFRTAVYDEFGDSPMRALEMAQQTDAITAVSGDYFSAHLNHGMLIIRNGKRCV